MVGARLWKSGKPSEFEFEIESAYQSGDIGPQSRFEHFQHGETGTPSTFYGNPSFSYAWIMPVPDSMNSMVAATLN